MTLDDTGWDRTRGHDAVTSEGHCGRRVETSTIARTWRVQLQLDCRS